MKFQVEIAPVVEDKLDGQWVIIITPEYHVEHCLAGQDITHAREILEEQIGLAIEQAYPGVEEYYR